MDWTDISITCVCIKHYFSLPSNEFTVKCVGRVTVAEKKKKQPLWCEMYFSVKKSCHCLSANYYFPLCFLSSTPSSHVLGFCVFLNFVLGIPTPLPKKNELLFANVLKVSFLGSSKKSLSWIFPDMLHIFWLFSIPAPYPSEHLWSASMPNFTVLLCSPDHLAHSVYIKGLHFTWEGFGSRLA